MKTKIISISLGLLFIAIFVGIALANPMSDAREALGWLGLLLLAGIIYCLPAVVAWQNAHHNAAAITVLTLFGGWTIIGWIVALVWAYTKPANS